MNYVELQDAVMFNTFDRTSFRPFVKRWLNDAQKDIAKRLNQRRISTSVTLTSGTGLIPMWKVSRVSLADGTILEPIPTADKAGLPSYATGSTPIYYSLVAEGNSLRMTLVPAVTTSVTVTGYQEPVDMAADTDTGGLGTDFDEALIAFARARAFRYEDDMEMAAAWEAEYISQLRVLASVFKPNDDGPSITPGYEDYGLEPHYGGA